VVKATAIIVVDILLRRVVIDEKVVVDLSPLHDHVRLACTDGGQERLSIPRVERSVVATLSAR
jgi:hypothetical protein